MNKPLTPNCVLDTIHHRRSVRSYTREKLDAGTVHVLLKAAVHAPTAIHGEPWAFVVVQDTDLIRSLSDRAKKYFVEEVRRIQHDGGVRTLDSFQDPDFNFFYNASTLILVCGKSMGLFVAADCWLAAENLMLAASSMDLGTCVVGSAISGLNSPEVKAELGISVEFSVVAPIIVGGAKRSCASYVEEGAEDSCLEMMFELLWALSGRGGPWCRVILPIRENE